MSKDRQPAPVSRQRRRRSTGPADAGPGMSSYARLTGTRYADTNGHTWEIAVLVRHTALRPSYAYTLAEARAIKQLIGMLQQDGASGVSTITGGPDEVGFGVAEAIVGYREGLCIRGTETRRILLILQRGEARAVELGLLAAADRHPERQTR
jgi:hypothetical protein